MSIWVVLHFWSSHVQTNWWCCNGFPIGSDSGKCIFISFQKTVALRMPPPPPHIFPKVFKRYVDDIFAMFRWQSHLNDFVNYINTTHTNIRFTSEFEENYSFSFLDVKITRRNNQLVTSVFRKTTFSGVFTNLNILNCW